VIGFAAFLAHLAGGGGSGGFNPRGFANNKWNWNYRSTANDVFQSTNMPEMTGCVVVGIAIGVLIAIAFVVVCLWIGSRGKFIFTDCIVRNRGAIVEPWHEFRREGNSYFLYALIALFSVLVLLGLASIPIWLPFMLRGDVPEKPALLISLIGLGCVALIVGATIGVVSSFMVPIMYRRRCGAMEAFRTALAMITAEPGPVILYVLFLIVLWVAFAMISCLTTCITCCIAALPYIGTVILLPFYVFLMSYLLLFVRQFGPEYDVWANVTAAQPAALTEAGAPERPVIPEPASPPPTDEPPAPPPPVQP
ncbi:MAG: hypothetical protein ACJ8HQ_06965, partial [Chthoniobacterales bacterium]